MVRDWRASLAECIADMSDCTNAPNSVWCSSRARHRSKATASLSRCSRASSRAWVSSLIVLFCQSPRRRRNSKSNLASSRSLSSLRQNDDSIGCAALPKLFSRWSVSGVGRVFILENLPCCDSLGVRIVYRRGSVFKIKKEFANRPPSGLIQRPPSSLKGRCSISRCIRSLGHSR